MCASGVCIHLEIDHFSGVCAGRQSTHRVVRTANGGASHHNLPVRIKNSLAYYHSAHECQTRARQHEKQRERTIVASAGTEPGRGEGACTPNKSVEPSAGETRQRRLCAAGARKVQSARQIGIADHVGDRSGLLIGRGDCAGWKSALLPCRECGRGGECWRRVWQRLKLRTSVAVWRAAWSNAVDVIGIWSIGLLKKVRKMATIQP